MATVEPESSKLLESVRTTCGALNLGRQHAALVAVAETLARTVDQLVADDRPQLLGQTVPPLIRVLEQLAAARPGAGGSPAASPTPVCGSCSARRTTMGPHEAAARALAAELTWPLNPVSVATAKALLTAARTLDEHPAGFYPYAGRSGRCTPRWPPRSATASPPRACSTSCGRPGGCAPPAVRSHARRAPGAHAVAAAPSPAMTGQRPRAAARPAARGRRRVRRCRGLAPHDAHSAR